MIINAPWYVSNLTLHEDLKRSHTSEKSYSKSTQNIIGNWKHTPTLYFTLYWTLAAKTTEADPARGPAMR